MPVYNSLARYVKDIGIKQSWIAQRTEEINKACALDSTKLSLALRGKRDLSADEFLCICKALEVSPDVFMGDRT